MKMFGYEKREEMANFSITSIYEKPEDRTAFLALINKQGHVKEVDFRFRRKDGSVLDTLVSVTLQQNEDGTGRKYFGTVRDVTEYKKALTEIGNSRSYLNNIINSIADPIFVKNDKFQVILANDAACKLMRMPRENLIGMTLNVSLPKEEMDIFLEKDRAVLESGQENINEESLTVEVGKSLTLVTKKTRYIDDQGNKFLVAVIRDITERKKAESALKQIVVAVENSLDAIISEKLDGTVQSWNAGATKLFGYTAEEMIGKSISLLLPSDKKNESSELLAKVAHGEAVLNYETIRVSKDGTKLNVSISIAPIKEGNTTTSASLIERDITEYNSKKAELNLLSKRVLELQSTKNEFVAIAAHQLRAPISTISGFAELFLVEGKDNLTDKQRESIETIQKSSSSMNELVNFLLKITRAESGKASLELSPVNLRELVDTIVEILGSELNPRNQTVEVVQDPNPFPYVFLDKEMIKQVTMNLLSNASRYSPKNSTIKVQMTLEGINIKLSVIDSGIGIPKEAQGKIFDKFFRAENAKMAQTDGTGLGLALTKSLVEVWGGQMGFESEKTKGSTFYFTMPILGQKEASQSIAL
jgi:PAS domain S-box-containing protein